MTFWKVAKDKLVVDRLFDEKMHAMAVREIGSGVRRDGLWAKAVLLGNLDERQTKLAYLRLLVQHLKDEHYYTGRTDHQRDAANAAPRQPERTKREGEADAAIIRARSLVAMLRKHDLNFEQYRDLAVTVGAEFGYRGLLGGSWQVKLRGTTTEFKKFEMLRPWFLDNIAPRV